MYVCLCVYIYIYKTIYLTENKLCKATILQLKINKLKKTKTIWDLFD